MITRNTTTRSVWQTARQPSPNSAIKNHQVRKEITSHEQEIDLSSLKPGQMATGKLQAPPSEERNTSDDKLTFSNGGTIEDKPKEGGLLLTYPDGTQREMTGSIDGHFDEPRIHVRSRDRFGDWNNWTQTITNNGGTHLSVNTDIDELNREISVAADGTVQAEGNKYGSSPDLTGQTEGSAIVLKGGSSFEAYAPPVPMDWILS